MFVMRYWRTSMFGNSLLRTVRQNIHHSGVNQLSEPSCLQKDNIRYNKFKGHPYVTYDGVKCWNCQTILDIRPCLFCKNCSIIQSPEDQNLNYFELFNINVQYDIDTVQLTTNFRKLQNLMHPDRFSNKTEEERLLSESFSSLLNKSYTTLLNPLLRGLYMLHLGGLSIDEDSITMDTTFLYEIMDWNEKVEEVNTKESLASLKKDIDDMLVDLYTELSKAFSENDKNQAKLLLSKAKFFSTLLEKIKDKDVL
ncbi:co-chaperone protein HscB homolog [Aphis gossypii]|uniref:J domain-containing protein n=1 Tax=Aphis gossypii TaxID=80765 RepID=A0A9P0NR00_APHGO|nr:co-chaperone protein HscB homolog [Aphis gossypii]CAH1738025.1 unnamed protein product [Aphis gossypii]